MKRAIFPTLLLSIVILAGCTGPNTFLIRTATAGAVQVGVQQAPDAKPYLQAVAPIVCAAAHGTNVSPDAVMTAIESSSAANAVKTDSGKLIANGIITICQAAFDEFGGPSAISNSPTAQKILQAVCAGMNQGLAAKGTRRCLR